MARVEGTERQSHRGLFPRTIQEPFTVLDVPEDIDDLQRFLHLAAPDPAQQEFKSPNPEMFGCAI
jgi:hypothetical protein